MRSIAAALAVLTCACTAAPAPPPPAHSYDDQIHIKEVEAWRAKHEADYRREWVTIAGLHPLKSGRNTVGSSPSSDIPLPAPAPPTVGYFTVADKTVGFTPEPGAPVRLRDAAVTSTVLVHGGEPPASGTLSVGDVQFLVHLTGDRRTIRVRDPNGPQARSFLGFTWFPIDPEYRVIGRFIKDAEPNRMKVPNTIGDEDVYATDGVVEFTLFGQTLRLRPFTTRPKRFYFVFRDASSGHETYETARFFYADLRDDNSVIVDFNQAYNPPCAFNPYTTCPIPLRENRMTVKILAGEKAYPIKVEQMIR